VSFVCDLSYNITSLTDLSSKSLSPKQLWNSISMDFIEKLPSFSKFDTILVIVN